MYTVLIIVFTLVSFVNESPRLTYVMDNSHNELILIYTKKANLLPQLEGKP